MIITTYFINDTGQLRKFIDYKHKMYHTEVYYDVYMDCYHTLYIDSNRRTFLKYKFIRNGLLTIKKKRFRQYQKDFEVWGRKDICLKAFWSNEEIETDNCKTGCEETYCKEHPTHKIVE